jgi:hypothetical protein
LDRSRGAFLWLSPVLRFHSVSVPIVLITSDFYAREHGC